MRPEYAIGCAIAIVAALAGAGPAAAGPNESAYTKHDWQACTEVPSDDPGIVEVRRCAGLAGIAATWTGDPDASALGFGRVPADEEMGLGDFFEPRGTVEWRGPRRKGALALVAAIVRYDVGANIGRLDATRLVVYRLQPDGRSCIMAVIAGGPGANEAARRLIDRAAAGFTCGASRRLAS